MQDLSSLTRDQTCVLCKGKWKWKWSHSVVSDSAAPWTVACQDPLSVGFSSKNTGVGCYFLLQEIFLIQGLNLGFPHCSRRFTIWVTKERELLILREFYPSPFAFFQSLFLRPWSYPVVMVTVATKSELRTTKINFGGLSFTLGKAVVPRLWGQQSVYLFFSFSGLWPLQPQTHSQNHGQRT